MKAQFRYVNNVSEGFTNKHDHEVHYAMGLAGIQTYIPIVRISTPPTHTLLILYAAFKLRRRSEAL
jgi:hypothetical protein